MCKATTPASGKARGVGVGGSPGAGYYGGRARMER